MSTLPSTASIVARQVRIVVKPPTRTLFESSAILSEVQARFGPLTTFVNERYHTGLSQGLKKLRPKTGVPSENIFAIFRSPTSKTSALETPSLDVTCGGDLLPSPAETDPFNIRGHQGRYHPARRCFSCSIVDENDPDLYQLMIENNQDLGTQARSHKNPEAAEGPSSDLSERPGTRRIPDQLAGGLMKAWRNGTKNDGG